MNYEPNNTLDRILYRLFDYAGMFPPAGLPFEAALLESSSFGSTLKRPWMLTSDLVLDTEHARKLHNVNVGSYGFPSPLTVCLLGTEEPERVLSAATLLLRKEPPIKISSLELKAAPDALPEAFDTYAAFADTHHILLAIEPNLSGEDWVNVLKSTVSILKSSPLKCAFKCRFTGPTAIDSNRFATVLAAITDAGLPLKVTGGLHHPIVEPELHDFPMGFLNVVVAVMLRRSLGAALSQEILRELLTNRDQNAFSFGESLTYKNFALSLAEIAGAKESAPFTVGSCSLHDPDSDLLRLYGADS